MSDLKSPKLIKIKGALFLLVSLMACLLLLAEVATWRNVLLLVIALWSFARFYYFLFYVLEHYVDPTLRYAGIWALLREALQSRGKKPGG